VKEPPRALRIPKELVCHGDVRIDDYYWLRKRDDPRVRAYLEAENAYTEAVMAPTRDLRVSGQLSFVDASFRDGPYQGNEIPMVAERTARLALDYALSPVWSLFGEAVYTGERRLDGDFDNVRPSLDSVTLLNANLRYASEAETEALFQLACERADVPYQKWVNRTDLACGSTIGPLTAASLGIRTVDVGNPQLAMHSARETCGSRDPGLLVRALASFFE